MKSITQQCLFLYENDFDEDGVPPLGVKQEINKHELVVVNVTGRGVAVLKNRYGTASSKEAIRELGIKMGVFNG